MAKNRFFYLAVFAGALTFALAYESRLTLVLFAGVATLPIVTFVLLLFSRLLLRTETEPKSVFTHKLQQFGITIRIKNRFIIPVSPLRITGIFHDTDGSVIGDRRLILNVMPLSSAEFLFSGNIKYRGEYTLGIEKIEIYDLLRIFRFKIKLTPDCCVVVAPRKLTLHDNDLLSADDYDSTMTKVSFMDNMVFSGVRNYADGDLLKHVHWKLSAKHDDLMVKQMEQNLGGNAVVIADLERYSETEEENMKAADAVIESALAITRKIISDGRSVINVFRAANGMIDAAAVESTEDYENLFSAYSVIPLHDYAGGAAATASEVSEIFSESVPVFIITPAIDADGIRSIINSCSKCKDITRIYLTAAEADDELVSVCESAGGITIHEIDPDDIVLSIHESNK